MTVFVENYDTALSIKITWLHIIGSKSSSAQRTVDCPVRGVLRMQLRTGSCADWTVYGWARQTYCWESMEKQNERGEWVSLPALV